MNKKKTVTVEEIAEVLYVRWVLFKKDEVPLGAWEGLKKRKKDRFISMAKGLMSGYVLRPAECIGDTDRIVNYI